MTRPASDGALPASDGALPTAPQPPARLGEPRTLPGARAGQAASLLPRLVMAVGAFVALTDAFAFGQASLAGIQALLPFDTPAADPLIAALSAIGLTALTVGLFRGKRLAWWLAILVFAAGVPVQLLGLGHTAGGVVAGIALALLTLDRKRYGVRSARTWSWTAW